MVTLYICICSNLYRVIEVTPEAMELLIEFCYTSTITIEEENVQQLLPAACLLQMSQIQQYCCEFLSKQLHPTNCLGKYIVCLSKFRPMDIPSREYTQFCI